jgi:hypothetical protein
VDGPAAAGRLSVQVGVQIELHSVDLLGFRGKLFRLLCRRDGGSP